MTKEILAKVKTVSVQDLKRASSERKPPAGDAGYIAEKIFRPSGSYIIIYKAAEQGIDVGGDKYAVVCSKHASIVSDTNLPGARVSMKYPAFCEDCMAEEHSTPNDKSMTKEILAAQLTGREYGSEISKEEEAAAKAAGLLVIFGASDDLMEFRGIIHDEAYPGEEGVVKLHRAGLLDEHDEDCECKWCCYEATAKKCAGVQAQWCKEKGYSWTYKTELPHATFEIGQDGGKYCRGIVIEASALPSL